MASPTFFRNFKARKPLSVETKQVIINVYVKLRTKYPEKSITSIVNETAELTGASVSTVFAIKKDMRVSGKPSPPRRTLFKIKDSGKAHRAKKFDTFTLSAIRRIVHNFFFANVPPTLQLILEKINEDENLPNIKQSSLRRILSDLGFVFKRRSRDSILIDRVDIQLARRNYLRSMQLFRREGRDIYYLDETWANAGHHKDYAWHDTTVKSAHQALAEGLTVGLKAPSGKGQRLIITHAGSDAGFVPGAEDIFIGKKGSGDYHEEMDGYRFEQWFCNKLLPNIKPRSVIVMDNASYHSVKVEKIPTKSTRKAEIQAWLSSKDIPWTSDMIIAELLLLVNSVRHIFDAYRIDSIAEKAGHTTLRLPPYHCELNPIELVWGHVKNRIAARNRNFTLSEIKVLAKDALSEETTDMWKNSVQHVIEVENKFWCIDNITDIRMDSFVITVNTGQSDTSEDDEDDFIDG